MYWRTGYFNISHSDVLFCPHLQKKEVISTDSEQGLQGTNLAYDYVSQLYLRTNVGDTARESSSRIWEKKNGE
ncbi:hypothetical protein [Saccharicrinis sp. FJH54]|uniref:hypothetical protein n=1 Tax=Saccharicrinis sp. FJH54 TaxID=3344665 RepID=UPI0035D50949